MSKTEQMRDIELGMTNFDGSIDRGLAEALQAEPARVRAIHAGWDFCGRVWFEGGKFHEEVSVYCVLQKVITAETLPDLMEAVCKEFGYR